MCDIREQKPSKICHRSEIYKNIWYNKRAEKHRLKL